jgi:hypothetical protein
VIVMTVEEKTTGNGALGVEPAEPEHARAVAHAELEAALVRRLAAAGPGTGLVDRPPPVWPTRVPTPEIAGVVPYLVTFEGATLEISGSSFGQGGDVLTVSMLLTDGSKTDLQLTHRTDTLLTAQGVPGSWHAGVQTAGWLYVTRAGVESNRWPITVAPTVPVIANVSSADAAPATAHDVHPGQRLLITGMRFVPPVTVHFQIGAQESLLRRDAPGQLSYPDDYTQIVVFVPPELDGVAEVSECWIQVSCATGTSEWWGAPDLKYHNTVVEEQLDLASIPDLADRTDFKAIGLAWYELLDEPAPAPGQPVRKTILHGHHEGIVWPSSMPAPAPLDIGQGYDTFFKDRASLVGDPDLALLNGWHVVQGGVEFHVTTTASGGGGDAAPVLARVTQSPPTGSQTLRTRVFWWGDVRDVPSYQTCDYTLSIRVAGPKGIPKF